MIIENCFICNREYDSNSMYPAQAFRCNECRIFIIYNFHNKNILSFSIDNNRNNYNFDMYLNFTDIVCNISLTYEPYSLVKKNILNTSDRKIISNLLTKIQNNNFKEIEDNFIFI